MGILDFFTGDQPPLIKGALEDFCVVLETGRDMFAAAAGHLLDNEILETELDVLYDEIHAGKHAVRRAVLEHLNLDPKRELAFCLRLVTAVQEASCVGHCGQIMGRAAALAKRPRLGPAADGLREVRTQLYPLFDEARDSFVQGDPTKARALLVRHQSIQSTLTAYLGELAGSPNEGEEVAVYTMAGIALERTGAHLANIASVITAPFATEEA